MTGRPGRRTDSRATKSAAFRVARRVLRNLACAVFGGVLLVSGCATGRTAETTSDAVCPHTRCAADGGRETCGAQFATSCEKVTLFFSESFAEGLEACLSRGEPTTCASAETVTECLATGAASVTPSPEQAKLAEAYCSRCIEAPLDDCPTALYFANDGASAIGRIALPFTDLVVENIEKTCLRPGCRSTFPECAREVVVQTLAPSSVDEAHAVAVECTLDAMFHGASDTSRQDGGGAPRPCGITSCDGCCAEDGQCLAGNTDDACGTAGRACTECNRQRACVEGACVDASCRLTCRGCCTEEGACTTGAAAGACGEDGAACVACGPGRRCTEYACTVEAASRWTVHVRAAIFPSKNASGGAWDAFGSLPDPGLTISTGNRSGKTGTAGDTLSPEWNVDVLTDVLASDILARFTIEAIDDDPGPFGDDFMGLCNVVVDQAMFDGQTHSIECPAAPDGVAFEVFVSFTPE